MSIKFGTDGWRAIIAEDFTFDNVRRCAQGVADYLRQSGQGRRSMVIGHDTRFASEDFAAAAAEVLAGNGVRVHLCPGPAPTPTISFTVTRTDSAGAIIITASHNPARWNGFKYKTQDGASAPEEVVGQIEKNITDTVVEQTKKLPLGEALEKGLVKYHDPVPAYFKRLSRLVDLETLRRQKIKVIVDPMYGAGMGYFRTLLEGDNMEIVEINSERNPLFPGVQPEPIAKNLGKLSRLIRKEKAAVGLATDGDADRIGIMDEEGNFLNQHQVFALLSLYLLEVRGERGAIIKTLTSTKMLTALGKLFGVPVYETSVGFKYVAPMMMEKNALIGGEESGGYGFRGHIPERDGILAGLYFLDFMAKTGKTPSQLLAHLYDEVGPHYYDRTDFHFPADQRETILKRVSAASPDAIAGIQVSRLDTTDGFRFMLGEDSWLLVRFSGTEPLLRIYAEAESQEKVRELLEAGRKIADLQEKQ
ncbi:MAG: phosphoglucomutase/phosphomannomutase family protein [Dehalococcoidia bacterium]|nr:phosphoglucomutase/phosphomannomutase family protein [Dehalococcoidia bacterium]